MKKIRVSNFHKVLALLLAFATLLPVVFASNIIPFADNLEDAFMRDFAIVDCKGVFAHATIRLYKNPIQAPNDYIAPKDLPDEFVVEFSFTDSATGKVWYILDTDNWDDWADDAAYCYVKADDVNLLNTEVVDGEGKEVGEYIIVDGENYDNNFRKYFIAKSGLVGDLSYQWQVLYGAKWVDIRGETENQIKLTHGKIHSLMDADRIYFRCVVTNGKETSSSPMHCIHVQHSQDTVQNDYYAHAQSSFALQTVGNDVMPLDETTVTTYTFKITYHYADGSIAAPTYEAEVIAGQALAQTHFEFTQFPGYASYVNDEAKTSIDYTDAINSDVTIDVVYKPVDVKYTVIHYQQNINDDGYTVIETEEKTGLNGSAISQTGLEKTYEGFYNLPYEPTTIAADGSTVIEIYYDRYYYLMNFDMDGGYGTDPVYARYGADVGTVKEPTKPGYNFLGWATTKGETEASKKVELPTVIPAESKTYYAIWQAVETAKVTVVFWGENADDEQYSYLSDFTKEIYLKPGREFTYSEGEMMVCDKEVHTHTDACLGCGKTEHTHSQLSQNEIVNGTGNACYELSCTVVNHTHGTGCYAGVGNQQNVHTGLPDNPQEGQVYDHWYYDNLIYIKGSWYKYTGSTASGSIAPATCGLAETTHTHTSTCYTLTCTIEEHAHTNACYTCGKEEHAHGSACYEQGAGLDTTKWKFVKSDTVTVAADGSTVVNVYYDRVEYSVQFYNGSGNTEYTDIKITAKWGASIGDKWPTRNNSGTWAVNPSSNNNVSGPYQIYMQEMPVGGDKFYGPRTDSGTQSAYYYVEVLPGETGTETYNGKSYKLHHTDTSPGSGYVVTDDDKYAIQGFTFVGFTANRTSSYNQDRYYYNGAKFYYTRNNYSLTFNDQYNDVKKETVQFEAPLSTYKDYVPEVPSAYEPGSVVFGGWYQNPQCTGEEYKLDEHKMPANDIILYAKWVPVERNVKFYLTESSTEVYQPTGVVKADFTLPHGGYIAEDYVKNHLDKASMNIEKPNGDYTFVMWYYYKDPANKTGKTPFDPTTSIRQDLVLYGEWSSNVLKEYTVQYVLKDDHSVKVAKDTVGYGLGGSTKTVMAKGSSELYDEYKDSYFPTVRSKSVILDMNKSGDIIVIFEYVPADYGPYEVRYVTEEEVTGATTYVVDGKTYYQLHDPKKVTDNTKASVIETFQPISGYMPDAYQKTLIVTSDETDNILYFYYTRDTEHAYYKISHHTQNLDGTTYTEYTSNQNQGTIGTTYAASPITISGFTYDHWEYVTRIANDDGTVTETTTPGTSDTISAALTNDGMEIKLYYNRNSYPYQVRYLEQGTGKELHDPKNGTGEYGQIISESAIDIEGYDKVDPTSATLNIRIDEGEGAPKLNIITFYYKEKEVTINYVAVGPDGATDFGSVSPTTETVKVTSGTAQGSTATPGDGFKFVGWYKDEACTQPVDTSWVTDTKIVPQKTDGKNVAATYYAKFEYDVTSLTIKKELAEGTTAEAGTKFIFDVKDSSGNLVTTVTIEAGKSVTINGLKVGDTYTVTERDWSWRYEPVDGKATQTIELVASSNVITFTNTKTKDKWLDKDSSCVNSFKNKTETPTID